MIHLVLIEERKGPTVMVAQIISTLAQQEDDDALYTDIKNFQHTMQYYPEGSGKKDHIAIRRLVAHFII